MNLLKQLKFTKKHKLLIFIIIAIFVLLLTVSLVSTRQDLRQRALEDQTITKILFSPGAIDTQKDSNPTYLSVSAVNSQGQTITKGTSYSWGISSSNSIGTLESSTGNIATFYPLNDGVGDIFVSATNAKGSLTASIPVIVGNNNTTGEIRGIFVEADGLSSFYDHRAIVRLQNENTGVTYTTESNPGPDWAFYDLPEGDYKVTADNIDGYTIDHQVCFNCINEDRFFNGNTFSVSVDPNRYIGVTFRFTPVAVSPTITPAKTGDFNGDKIVDIFDLSILLSNWNKSNFKYDLNKNGQVDIFDLSILLTNWDR